MTLILLVLAAASSAAAPRVVTSPRVSVAPLLSASPAVAARVALPTPVLAPAAIMTAPSLNLAPPAAAPLAAPQAVSPVAASAQAASAASLDAPKVHAADVSASLSRVFDGSGRPPSAPVAVGEGWTPGEFASPVDGTPIRTLERPGADASRSPTVFIGGMALQESFDSLFALEARPAAAQVFARLRGHPPSGWTPTRAVLDADARDLARLILRAAERSPGGKVDLVLHSYGTLVLQRLVQLRGEAEPRRALSRLKGARITLVNGTSHQEGSESLVSGDLAQAAKITRMFVDWLSAMDAAADMWRKAAELNPMLIPSVQAYLAAWKMEREGALALAAKPVVTELRKHLQGAWPAQGEPARRAALERLGRLEHDPVWQEAAVRRVNDGFSFDFTAADARFLRRLAGRLDVVVSDRDQVVPWEGARLLLTLLGVPAPEAQPAAGTVLRAGAVRAEVFAGDHYLPLNDARRLQELLAR